MEINRDQFVVSVDSLSGSVNIFSGEDEGRKVLFDDSLFAWSDRLKYYDDQKSMRGQLESLVREIGEIGKLCFAEYRGDRERMYLSRVNAAVDVSRKFGWWDTFTLSEKKISKEGMYICKISRFCHDKMGNTILFVYPIRLVDKDVMKAICYAESQMGLGMLSVVYRYNTDLPVRDTFGYKVQNLEWVMSFDWDSYFSGVSLGDSGKEADSEILSLMKNKTKEELWLEEAKSLIRTVFVKLPPNIASKYPNVVRYASLDRFKGSFGTDYYRFIRFCEDEYDDVMGYDSSASMMEKVIYVCDEREKRRQESKKRNAEKKRQKINERKASKVLVSAQI